MKKSLLVLAIIITLTVPLGHSVAFGNWDQAFAVQVQAWIQHIAKEDTCCTDWSSAEWRSQSNGPNSRQWIITIYTQRKPIGYLIVGEDESSNLFLVEYGNY